MRTSPKHLKSFSEGRLITRLDWKDSSGKEENVETEAEPNYAATWVTSNIDVTQNCQQPNGETLTVHPKPRYSHDRNLNHNLVHLFLNVVH